MSIIDTLIYDRNASDLSEYLMLRVIPYNSMTESQKEKWNKGLRGAYNYTDINRVNEAVEYIKINLSNRGYNVIINLIDEVDVTSIPNKPYFETYLSNVQALVDGFVVKSSTPSIPSNVEEIKTIMVQMQ